MIYSSMNLKCTKLNLRSFLSLAGWLLLILLLMHMMEGLPSKQDWSHFATRDTLMAVMLFSVMFLSATALRCLRFGYLIRRSVAVPWLDIVIGFPWLFFIGAITPFRIGEGMRAVWLKRHHGDALTAIGYWVGEKISDILILVFLLILGGLAAPTIGVDSVSSYASIGFVFIFCYGILWLCVSHLRDWFMNINFLRRIGIHRFMETFTYMHATRSHFSMFLTTISIWFAMALAFYYSLRLLLGDIPLTATFFVLGAVNLSSLVTVIPGNIGGYQAAMVFALTAYHIDTESSFMASVVLHGANLIVTITLGLAAHITGLVFLKNTT